MWDVGRDGDFVIASSGIGDDSHREPVSRLQWVTGHDGKNKKHNVSIIVASTNINQSINHRFIYRINAKPLMRWYASRRRKKESSDNV